MQVAPYDLAELGVIPIKVETPEGRDIFVFKQIEFASRAQELRQKMISVIESTTAPMKIQG
jgi:hypothetical protein